MKPKHKLGTLIEVKIDNVANGPQMLGEIQGILHDQSGYSYRLGSAEVFYHENQIIKAYRAITSRKRTRKEKPPAVAV